MIFFNKKTSGCQPNRRETEKGFTLLETLVAILLLSVSIAGAATIAQKALQAAEYSRDETTAYYLAAEGIELVQNIRDGNSLSNLDWLNGLSSDCEGGTCDINPLTEAITPACPENGCPLYINAGQYSDSTSGTATIFSRAISIQPVTINVPGDAESSPNEAYVTATVTWNTGAFSTRSISLKETLFNWY